MFTLAILLEALAGRPVPAPPQVLRSAVIDSRQATRDSLFIALPGGKADGHAYVGDAFQRGAAAAIVERDMPPEFRTLDLTRPAGASLGEVSLPICLRVDSSLLALQRAARFWRDRLNVRVIGITGSVGKSTTKELTAEVLERRFRTLRNPGNLNNEIGLPLTLLHLSQAHERVVLEMGFYVPGEIALLCTIAQPQVGVVTNLSHVHLERAGSLEAIVRGKAELVEALPPAPEGTAVLNIDEELVRGMAAKTRAAVLWYGTDPAADLWADRIEGLGLEGVRFVMHYRGEAIHARVPLLGRHSVHTALRAAAVGLTEGLTWQEIIGGLQSPQAQVRLVAVQGPGGSLLLDDTYNAAPTSVIAALNLLSELDGRRVAVLGDMLELGDYEERGHRLVGARAAEVADELIAVGERARWIADEAVRAGLNSEAVVALASAAEATAFLRQRVRQGDIVLIKGSRGMQMDQIVAALEERE